MRSVKLPPTRLMHFFHTIPHPPDRLNVISFELLTQVFDVAVYDAFITQKIVIPEFSQQDRPRQDTPLILQKLPQ